MIMPQRKISDFQFSTEKWCKVDERMEGERERERQTERTLKWNYCVIMFCLSVFQFCLLCGILKNNYMILLTSLFLTFSLLQISRWDSNGVHSTVPYKNHALFQKTFAGSPCVAHLMLTRSFVYISNILWIHQFFSLKKASYSQRLWSASNARDHSWERKSWKVVVTLKIFFFFNFEDFSKQLSEQRIV